MEVENGRISTQSQIAIQCFRFQWTSGGARDGAGGGGEGLSVGVGATEGWMLAPDEETHRLTTIPAPDFFFSFPLFEVPFCKSSHLCFSSQSQ